MAKVKEFPVDNPRPPITKFGSDFDKYGFVGSAFSAASFAQPLTTLFHLTNSIFDGEILYQKLTMQFARWNAEKALPTSLFLLGLSKSSLKIS